MQRNSLFLGSGFLGLLLLAAAAALANPGAASHKPAGASAPASGHAAQVERGRYLVGVMSCGDCHTPGTFYGAPDNTRRLAGSEIGWRGPWGVTFARNLTPDPETGLGSWSEGEIVRALTRGIKKDGSPILPPMPWQNFSTLTEGDAHAIVAYLATLPAVRHAVPAVIPGSKPYAGAIIEFPPPPAWDAPRGGAPAGPGAK